MSRAQSTTLRVALQLGLVLSIILASYICAVSEQLPVKTYSTGNGLVHNRVMRIFRDSRGFLWLCTAGGISRFDGHKFVNYTVENGLPTPVINDFLEADNGIYWIATNSDGV